jgi:SIR2-like domain
LEARCALCARGGTLPSEHEDLIWHLNRLRRARLDGKLVFVLGSGINKPYRLPDWRELLDLLMRDCSRVRQSAGVYPYVGQQLQAIIADPLLQAAVGRQGYLKPELWLAAIRKHLQESAEFPVEARDKPLYQVADLVMQQYAADRHRHVPVLTFNYDDLMEKALRAAARVKDRPAIRSVSREREFAASIYRPGVWVYHLHGDANSDTSPILDAASYLRILGSPGRHWSWDCLSTVLFQRGTGAMFIGLSLVDPSLRLLLTQWAEKGLPISGIYVAAPPPRSPDDRSIEDKLKLATISRDIIRLFDEVLSQLSLIPYHVTVWDEIQELLKEIAS